MISVIIPTMWKCDTFLQHLTETVHDNSVDEIILIDNDIQSTPDWKILHHKKIKHHKFESNIYVVPAWNYGAKVAKNDILAFLSDDLEFDKRVFLKAYEFMTSTLNVGLVGLLTRYPKTDEIQKDPYVEHYTDGSITISAFPASTFGALFFMHKDNWKQIPNLLFVNGECLQYNRMNSLGKTNYMISNCRSESVWHVTLGTLPYEFIVKDNEVYMQLNEGDWVLS